MSFYNSPAYLPPDSPIIETIIESMVTLFTTTIPAMMPEYEPRFGFEDEWDEAQHDLVYLG